MSENTVPVVASTTNNFDINNVTHIKWPIDPKKYIFNEKIGQGATSEVFIVTCSENNKTCAIKIMNMEQCPSAGGLREIELEIASMKKLKHENIVTYFTSFITEVKLYIVMDICKHGSLLDIIKQTQGNPQFENGVFDERLIATILVDVLNGLQYIHDNDLVHRDLKCGNLLLRDDATIQIADFGVAGFLASTPLIDGKSSSSGGPVRRTFVGTPCWMAPEVMHQVYTDGNPGLEYLKEVLDPETKANGYNWKADMWSLGITTIEMAAGNAPYSTWQPMKVILTMVKDAPPTIDTCSRTGKRFENYGTKFRKFVSACLRKEAQKRPSAKELVSHIFIKSRAKDHEYLRRHMIEGTLHPPSERVFRPPTESDLPRRSTTPVLKDNTASTSDDSSLSKFDNGASVKSGECLDTWNFDTEQETVTGVGIVSTNNNNNTNDDKRVIVKDTVIQVPFANVTTKGNSLTNGRHLRITLRKRLEHNNNELQDISFDFVMGIDSTSSLANELVDANLIDRKDLLIVAENMEVLIENPLLKERLFQLYTPPPNDIPVSESEMQGYAKVIIRETKKGSTTTNISS